MFEFEAPPGWQNDASLFFIYGAEIFSCEDSILGNKTLGPLTFAYEYHTNVSTTQNASAGTYDGLYVPILMGSNLTSFQFWNYTSNVPRGIEFTFDRAAGLGQAQWDGATYSCQQNGAGDSGGSSPRLVFINGSAWALALTYTSHGWNFVNIGTGTATGDAILAGESHACSIRSYEKMQFYHHNIWSG